MKPIDSDQLAYSIELTLFPDFTSLLGAEAGTELTTEQGLEIVFSSGRALLQARAGAGKTVTLRRMSVAMDGDVHTLDLSSSADRDRFHSTDATERWLQNVVDGYSRRVLIEIDGLDTLALEDGQRVLEAVDRVTSRNAACAVIVADRLGRRPIREKRWALFGLSTVAANRARGHDAGPELADWQRLPLYLNLRSSGQSMDTAAEVLGGAISRALGGDEEEIDRLSEYMLANWSTRRRDKIGSHEVAPRLDGGIAERLASAGLLEQSGGVADLHVLLSGYLAARAAARQPQIWRRDLFDLLTFGGSTFDVLGLLLELVDDGAVDNLVRQVDNWNFYAAAHLLAEDAEPNPRVSDSLRSALLLLLGRRRFTQLPSTRRQVEDALILHGGTLATEILAARDEAGLVNLAMNRPDTTADWWQEWLAVYLLVNPAQATAEAVSAVASADGLLGWTAANILISLDLSSAQEAAISDMAIHNHDAVVRWRAVHVLAGRATASAAETCLRVFRTDVSPWVRYGALRSFVAVAANVSSASERAWLFLRLSEDSGLIVRNPKWRREIERSVILDNQPEDWPEAVGVLLEKLWAMSDSVQEQDRWRRLSARLRTGWAGGGEVV